MNLVIDASAAYDLLTSGRCAEKVLGAEDILAPDLIVSELLNARMIATLSLSEAASRLADTLDHPVYDCM